MTDSTTTPPVEHASVSAPFPSVARLVAALAFISIGCVSLHFPGFPSTVLVPLSFSAAGWLFTSSAEWQRRLTARDYLGLLVVFIVCAVLITTTRGKESPWFEAFIRQPMFLAALWLLLCSLYIWQWRVRRRSPRAQLQ